MNTTEISVILPCLNEETTVGYCIDEIKEFFESNNINGEIILVDNASTDASADVALSHGANVVKEEKRGYGYAIRKGLENATGKYLMIGDCDTTYNFKELGLMYDLLKDSNADMVIGNRFLGNTEKGAISLSHRYGVKFLSLVARMRFHTDVVDFHCGLRGLTFEAYKKLSFHSGGMEFATEMIAEAARKKLKIAQFPVALRKSKYERESKLRTIRDGFRHLHYILCS